jgi:NitT/TauT family transport system ATP-binding protein
LSANIPAGKTTALIGPSGCGKSTLLHLIAGLENATSGSIEVLDDTPNSARLKGWLGFAFQDSCLLPWLTVEENINIPLQIQQSSDSANLVDSALNFVDLESVRKAYPHQLSHGMAERIGLARAIVNGPKVLLLDEPFRSLDQITRRTLNSKLRDIILRQGKESTTLLVTHSIEEAIFLADLIIVLSSKPSKVLRYIEIPKIDIGNTDHVFDAPELRSIREEVIDLLI